MGRGLGLQQQEQCYGNDGMWMDTHAPQQQGYGFHEESWGSDHNNNYHKQQQFPGMHMKIEPGGGANYVMDSHGNINKLGGNHGMFHETVPNTNYGHHGYGNYGRGNKLGGPNSSHHQFSNGGANKFNSGGHHGGGYNVEEYEEYIVEHHGGGKVKVDEMRYERHNYGGGDHGFHANPYGQNMNMNWKPHGHGGHKADWIAKGV